MSHDPQHPPPLTSAVLTWGKARTPASETFGDVYYTVDSGLEETRHVFLDGCGLGELFQKGGNIVVAETGFGTGLNFLMTWDLWRQTAPAGASLHYISVEGFPIRAEDLWDVLKPWPALKDLAAQLIRAYPPLSRGFHRLSLDDPSVKPMLLFGEAETVLPQLDAEVDAWFLDGFSPDRNPDMWSQAVLDQVARVSKPGTRLATYTAAGHVRRGLDAAGFKTVKKPGYVQKRDMTTAVFEGRVSGNSSPLEPWFKRTPAVPTSAKRVAILGGGIAGAATAAAFKARGFAPVIVDRHDTLAGEASGNPIAVVMPRVTANASIAGRIMAESYRFALQTLEHLADQGRPFTRDRGGAILLADTSEEETRLRAAANGALWPFPLAQFLSAKEVTALAGVPVGRSGLFFPNAGWVVPGEVIGALATGIELSLGQNVETITHAGGFWHVKNDAGEDIAKADLLVLASANGLLQFPECNWLPLEPKRGQVTMARASQTSRKLSTVLAGKGYVTPAHKQHHCLGATYSDVGPDGWKKSPGTTDHDHHTNLEMIETLVAGLLTGSEPAEVTGRAGLRCTTPDRLPVAGPVPARDAYLHTFRGLSDGHPWTHYEDPPYHHGLFALAGLGARGFITAFLCAEIIASLANGDPLPVEADLIAALHPGRFLVRDLKRLKV